MSIKSKILFSAGFFLLVASLLGCVLAAVYYYTPHYVEFNVIPDMADRFGMDNLRFKVRRIGFNGTDLGPIAMGDPEQPALQVESVRIGYSPVKLRRGRVDHVVISGLKLYAQYRDGEFTLRGINLDDLSEKLRPEENTTPDTGKSPAIFGFKSLAFRNASLFLAWGEKDFMLPLELRITPENGGFQVLHFSFSAFPQGGKVTASGRVDLDAGTVDIDYKGNSLTFASFADILPRVPGLRLSGSADVAGSATLSVQPFKISSLTAAVELSRVRIDHGRLSLTNSHSAQGMETPITLKVAGGGNNEWQLSLADAAVTTPIPGRIETVNSRLKIGSDTLECSGDFSLGVMPFNLEKPLPVQATEFIAVKGRFNASWANPGQWEFMLDTLKGEGQAAAKAHQLILQGIDISSRPLEFTASGSGTLKEGHASFRLNLPKVKAVRQHSAVSAKSLSLKGNARFDLPANTPRIFTDFTFSAAGLKLKSASARGGIPDLTVSGKLSGGGDGLKQVTAQVKFANATFLDSAMGLRIDGGRGRIPLHWPAKGMGRKGMVSVSGIQFKQKTLGSAAAVVRQKDLGLGFTGTHVSSFLPDLKVLLSGSVDLSASSGAQTVVEFKIPGYRPGSPIDLEPFVPAMRGASVDGELNLSGRLVLGPDGPTCVVDTAVKDASLTLAETGLSVSGVDISLSFPDLFQMRSAPAQQLRYQAVQMGDLKIEDGSVDFQLESDGSVFIEKSSFKWCGGSVDVHAMRISPGMEDYLFVLYCDRLLLAQILEQLGAVKAEGRGTLNGKIPVRFKRGELSFDNGFLYSSPGEGGVIRVSGTEMLTAGIPKDTLQYAQLELAREALKDYSYNWVKLGLNTEGKTLLIRMQMDGKPAKELPFRYDKKIGGFVKVKSGGIGSIFQGISLDVNFRLPLDKILTYQDILKNLE